MELSLYLYPVARDGGDLKALWRRFSAQLDAADAAGWHAVWTPEHHRAQSFFPPPLQLLSWVAARYPQMGVGTAVALSPLYHPLQLAEGLATLQSLSPHTYFGFGTGFRTREFTSVGADIAAKLDDTVAVTEICRALLAGEEVTFAVGAWKGAKASLPFAVDHPPVFLAAARTRAEVRRFGPIADGVIPNSMAGLARQVQLLSVMDEVLGHRAPVRPVMADVIIGKTEGIARERAARRLGAEFASFRHHQATVPAIARFAAAPADELELIADYAIFGDADGVGRRLEWLASMGVTQLLARVEQAETPLNDAVETIEALASASIVSASGPNCRVGVSARSEVR
jgi:alkanesulfonate monooxygenase SsuD/methylene tetrahydromethanopterin reductase-like flavin-dependent oxidoreductase (luciferase family)